MEERRFDELTRLLGSATSRRQVLKGVLGVAVGSALAGFGWRGRPALVAAAIPTCNGVTYDPSTQCCEPAGIQPRHPIANLDLCPNRVPHPGHVPSFNGCGPENGFLTYIIPNRIGPTRNVDFTPACNNHDICYDTCNSDKSTCDTNFFNDLSAACAAAYPGTSWYQTYMRTFCINVDAWLYYTAVARGGRSAYEDAQKEACDCCPACENCDGPNDKCCDYQCVDVSTDSKNCGDCGHACTDSQICTGGTCQCPDVACQPGKTLDPSSCQCVCSPANCPSGQLQDPDTCECVDRCANVTCGACQTCDPASGTCVQVADNTDCGNGNICCQGTCEAGPSCPGACQGLAQGTPCGPAGYCCVNDTTCENPVDTIGYDNHCCLQYDVWCSVLGQCTNPSDCCDAMGQGAYCGTTEHNEPICCGSGDGCCGHGYFFPGHVGVCAADPNSCP